MGLCELSDQRVQLPSVQILSLGDHPHDAADVGDVREGVGFQENEVVVVQVHETAGSARGDFLKRMAGVVRPALPWSSEPLGEPAGTPR